MQTYGLIMPGGRGPEYGEIGDIQGMVCQICSEPMEVALRKIGKLIQVQEKASEIVLGHIPDQEYLSIVNTVNLLKSVKEACEAAGK